ncbi:MAG: hypothetical protein KKC75_08830 [Nanoarchaeota archaeon]|nr:hypothetical protein [Nanoarchaeota archaeon]MBU1004955.1 hypothetical protein [Nanoarchaeota archaeon]MBU1946405.1 hypothetical protein [Nanoarchaeota archaeon]
MENKAQISTEYMVIMGIVFLITIPVLYYSMGESSIHIKLNQADDTVSTLARAADTVYSIGPGSRKYVSINLPGGIQSYSLENKTVLIKMYIFGGVSDVFSATKADLSGIIPISDGPHRIRVEMLESGYVQFGEANDTSPPSVVWASPSGTINYNGIVLRANTNEYSACRYDETDVSYLSMSQPFVGSALTHERDLGILGNGTYTFFVRCQDPSGNVMDYSSIINFTIVPPGTGGNGTNGTPQGTNETYEPYAPLVYLISPPDYYIDNDSISLFQYNVTDNSSILYCQLIINNTVDQYSFNVLKNTPQNFTKLGIDYGDYVWNVNCSDVHGNRNSSEIWNFKVNYTQDYGAPIVSLVSPADNAVRNYWLTGFSYNVTDITSGISYCDLHMGGILDDGGSVDWNIRDSPVTENQLENIIMPLFKGNYTWNVSCTDNSYNANEGYSLSRNIRINITAGEDAFLDSCAGYCGYHGFSDGACENNPTKCKNYCSNCYYPDGNQYCLGGEESDTCCCIP